MSNAKTVHTIVAGRALCGFSHEFPAYWPEGHIWTHIEDMGNITCPECKRRAAIILESRKIKSTPKKKA